MTYEEMYRRAFNVLRVKEDAEDAVQDTFLKWLETSEEPEKMLEKSISAIRRRQITTVQYVDETVHAPDVEWRGEETVAAEDEASNAEVELIEASIDDLPRRQRQVIVLLCDGYSIAEIASELGLTYDSAKMNISRARKKLQKGYQKRI